MNDQKAPGLTQEVKRRTPFERADDLLSWPRDAMRREIARLVEAESIRVAATVEGCKHSTQSWTIQTVCADCENERRHVYSPDDTQRARSLGSIWSFGEQRRAHLEQAFAEVRAHERNTCLAACAEEVKVWRDRMNYGNAAGAAYCIDRIRHGASQGPIVVGGIPGVEVDGVVTLGSGPGRMETQVLHARGLCGAVSGSTACIQFAPCPDHPNDAQPEPTWLTLDRIRATLGLDLFTPQDHVVGTVARLMLRARVIGEAGDDPKPAEPERARVATWPDLTRTEYVQPDGFAPPDAPRCTICGGTRLVKNGRLEVCAFLGCKDPTHDVRAEREHRERVDVVQAVIDDALNRPGPAGGQGSDDDMWIARSTLGRLIELRDAMRGTVQK